MELKSLVSYKSAFELTKTIMVVIVIAFAVAMVGGFLLMQNKIDNIQKNVIIIDKGGQVYDAEMSRAKDMRVYEYINHIKTFYTLWYSFDESSYKPNIEKALYLAGDCGKEMLNVYRDENVERMLFEKNLRFDVTIKDVKIDMTTIPVTGYIIGEQKIKRQKGQLIRHLDCKFLIYDVDRSENNPHGCKVDNWSIYNKDLIQ